MNTDTSNTMWEELPLTKAMEPVRPELSKRVSYVHNKVDMGKQCDRQIYLSFSIGSDKDGKLLGLIDTGADVNLISVQYLETQIRDWHRYDDCQEKVKIHSVTGDTVKPLAYKLLPVKMHRCPEIHMPFVIMPDKLAVKCIIGRPSLAHLQASLLYFTKKNTASQDFCDQHYYVLSIKNPFKKLVPLTHLAMPGLHQAMAYSVKLEPRTSTPVTFTLKINPYLTPESVCITCPYSDELPEGVVCFETKSTPIFMGDGTVRVLGVIVNDTDQVIRLKECTATVEEAGPHQTVAITRKSVDYPEEEETLPDYNNLSNCDLEEEIEPTTSKDLFFVSNVNRGPNKKYRKLLKKEEPVELGLGSMCFPNYHCHSTPKETTFQCCRIRVSNELEPEEEPYQTAEELLDEEIMPSISIPTKLPSAEDVVMSSINKEPEEIQPYLKKIFIEKYPSVVGTHNLDTGPVRYLGRIILRTKPGMKLPKSTKVYAVHPSEQVHLNDILSFMEKYGFISEVFQDDPNHPSAPHGAAAYLIKRKLIKGENVPNEGAPSFARLIIDYRTGGLNSILQETPALVKGIESCIEELRGSFLYSLIDLKQSYYGLCLSPTSFALTQFLVFPGRSFVWHRLPMGISTGPASLLEKCNLMLNFVPKTDDSGSILYEDGEDPKDEASRAQLIPNKVKNCINFYDDLLVHSERSQQQESKKLEQSLDEHFGLVEKLIGRMALFRFKITYPKCSWGKRYVDFLGWRIQDDKIIADESRIRKVQKFDYPKSRKQLQSFVGLVNTLKRVSPLSVGENLAVLASASSSKIKFEFTKEHKVAFDKIKQALTSQPLYCHLIDPQADKIIFTDSSSLAFGSVLLSRIEEKKIPTFQSHIKQTDPDPLNQVIRKHKVKAYIGEKYTRAEDSFFKSILFLIRYHNLHYDFKDTLELRHAVINYVKKETVGQQVKAQFCNDNYQMMHKFLHDRLGNTSSQVSAQDAVIYMVASFLKRGINVLKADMTSSKTPLIETIPDIKQATVPLTVGMYPVGNHTTAGHFVPLLEFKDWEFNPELLNSKYVVNYYDSKIIPVAQRSKSILELESTALLHSLKKYRSFITNCRVHIVTDSRSLFYLFSQAIVQSHTKISRFNLKLQADYPQVRVLWCSTYQNLADIFTRFGLTDEYETKIKFNEIKMEKMPTIPEGISYSWQTWDKIVQAHPKALEVLLDYAKTYNTKDKKKLERIHGLYTSSADTNSQMDGYVDRTQSADLKSNLLINPAVQGGNDSHISQGGTDSCHKSARLSTVNSLPLRTVGFTQRGIEQLKLLFKPSAVLRDRLSNDNIKMEQQHSLNELYHEILNGHDTYLKRGKYYYTLIDNVIYCCEKKDMDMKIVIPPTLEILVLAYIHVRHGHSSIESTLKTLCSTYVFSEGKMRPKTTNFVTSCTTCAINSRSTAKIPLSHLSLDTNVPPFYYTALDLIEKVTPFGSYSEKLAFKHILIMRCLTTGYLLLFPLKDKTTKEVLYHIMFGLFQQFGICKALYTDNASILRSRQFLGQLEALGVEVKETVPYDSKSRGYIERTVRSLKTVIRKLLHTNPERENNMVELLPLLGGLHMNSNVNMRTGSCPVQLVFGHPINANKLFGTQDENRPFAQPQFVRGHPSLASLPHIISREREKVPENIERANQRADKSVRRPVDKKLPVGTLIYALSQHVGPVGVSPTWLPYYVPSLYCVTRELSTAVVAARISDNTTIFLSKNAVKRARFYNRMEELPPEIKKALFLEYDELSQEQLDALARTDRFGHIPVRNTRQTSQVLADLHKQDRLDEEQMYQDDYSSDEGSSDEETPVQLDESSDEEEEQQRYKLRPTVRFNLPNN